LKINNRSIFDVGNSGLLFQKVINYNIKWIIFFFPHPNIITLLNIIIVSFGYFFLEWNNYLVVGIIIIISLFLDLADGSVARKLNKVSKLGNLLDNFSDYYFILFVIFVVFKFNKSIFILSLLIGFMIFSMATRFVINEIKNQPPLPPSGTSYLRVIFNHFDSHILLSLIIIIDLTYLNYWINFEIFRRSMIIMNRLKIILYKWLT